MGKRPTPAQFAKDHAHRAAHVNFRRTGSPLGTTRAKVPAVWLLNPSSGEQSRVRLTPRALPDPGRRRHPSCHPCHSEGNHSPGRAHEGDAKSSSGPAAPHGPTVAAAPAASRWHPPPQELNPASKAKPSRRRVDFYDRRHRAPLSLDARCRRARGASPQLAVLRRSPSGAPRCRRHPPPRRSSSSRSAAPSNPQRPQLPPSSFFFFSFFSISKSPLGQSYY